MAIFENLPIKVCRFVSKQNKPNIGNKDGFCPAIPDQRVRDCRD
jgi:hypothetical protein